MRKWRPETIEALGVLLVLGAILAVGVGKRVFTGAVAVDRQHGWQELIQFAEGAMNCHPRVKMGPARDEDVLDGLVSAQQARAVYGVVLSEDSAVNDAETRRLRAELTQPPAD